MKKFLGELVQYIGAFIVLCGIICTMFETANPVKTLLVGFALAIIGAVICFLGTEVESAR